RPRSRTGRRGRAGGRRCAGSAVARRPDIRCHGHQCHGREGAWPSVSTSISVAVYRPLTAAVTRRVPTYVLRTYLSRRRSEPPRQCAPCPCRPLLPAPRRDDPPQPTPHSQALDDTAGTISTLTSDAVPAHPRVSQQRERAVACDLRWSQAETETRSAITD